MSLFLLQVREMLDRHRHLDAFEIAKRLHADPDLVQQAITILTQLS